MRERAQIFTYNIDYTQSILYVLTINFLAYIYYCYIIHRIIHYISSIIYMQ